MTEHGGLRGGFDGAACVVYRTMGDSVGLIAQIWPHASPRLELASSHTNSSLELLSTFSSSIGIERLLRQSW